MKLLRNIIMVTSMLLVFAVFTLLVANPWGALFADRPFPVIVGFSVLTLLDQLPKALLFFILGVAGCYVFRSHSLRWTLFMAACGSLLQLVFTRYYPADRADLVIYTNYLILVVTPPAFSFVGHQVTAIIRGSNAVERTATL